MKWGEVKAVAVAPNAELNAFMQAVQHAVPIIGEYYEFCHLGF